FASSGSFRLASDPGAPLDQRGIRSCDPTAAMRAPPTTMSVKSARLSRRITSTSRRIILDCRSVLETLMPGPLVRTHLRARCLSVIAAGIASIALSGQAPPNPPVARKVPKVTTMHGVTLTDNYFWLRQKDAPAVKAYLDAENAYTEAATRHLATLRDTLYKEMLGRIKESDEQVPVWEDGYWYYPRTEKGKAYPIFCRRKGSPDALEEVYLDQNALAQGKKFHALGGLDVSPDG